jgi:2-C-methyl-D-erythritol 4-phosphate cytidylyltransferase/2-C-methyl-D-erythritol 2,4-cyclodiphosphate synthase
MSTWVLLAAAGKGLRLDPSGATPKQFLDFEGVPLFWHSAQVFARVAGIAGIVFIFPPEGDPDDYARMLDALDAGRKLGLERRVTFGGATRQESVRNGLADLPPDCRRVLVHDAARPFIDAPLIVRILEALDAGHKAVVPGLPVTDTVKLVDDAGLVAGTPERARLRAVQTPQGFDRVTLGRAHEAATNATATDDAALVEALGVPVCIVEGAETNRKITSPADRALLEAKETPMRLCCGFGYDVHRYGGERPFILGGVPIPTDIRVQAHSDGDTLLHALMDALLGCIGGGDIGGMFPDSDPKFTGISGGLLLAEVRERCLLAGLDLHHVDITIVAQTPRIAPHRELIAKNIATLLHLPGRAVNVKATTEEGLGFTGEKKGIKVMAQVIGKIPAQDR